MWVLASPILMPGLPNSKSEGVTFLEQPHTLGDTRAAMIEGPSHEAIELVEVK